MGDPWIVLGLDRRSSYADARRAYVTRSQLIHPDRHQGASPEVRAEAERAMRDLNDAWDAVRVQLGHRRDGVAPASEWEPARRDHSSAVDEVPTDPQACLHWVLRRLSDAARTHGNPLSHQEIERLLLPLSTAPSGRAFDRWLERRRVTLGQATRQETSQGDDASQWGRALRVLDDAHTSVVLMRLLKGG